MNSPQTIFLHARDLSDPAVREAYLDSACAGDPELRARLEALLANSDAADAYFGDSETQDGPAPRSPIPLATTEMMPDQIGPYRILERIGHGGMGDVYRAEQRVPIRREVALKVVKLGMDTKQVVARFEAERQALALMDHPHIAKVFGADADEKGRPYFAMEYVKGVPITEYADANHLTVKERLELFQQVCHAIQHAHQKGVIHRDIKPSNVLVSTQDGKPHAKVIDFGIAKATSQQLTDKTLFTQHDQFIGTPQYMSPEQATGSLDIDTRSDVYSLGVLLYELLTGQTPFDMVKLRRAALHEIARILREEEPPKPSTRLGTLALHHEPVAVPEAAVSNLTTLAKSRSMDVRELLKEFRGELDWLVMKAMEKDRARRYSTPNDLAEDVGRYLSGQAVDAAPPTFRYRAGKFVRRYRVAVAAVSVVSAVLLGSTVAISALAIRLKSEIKVSEVNRIGAEQARAESDTAKGHAENQQRIAEAEAKRAGREAARNRARYLMGQRLHDQALEAASEAWRLGDGGWEDGILISEIVHECRKTWDLLHAIPTAEPPVAAAIVSVPNGRRIAISSGKSLALYDLRTGELLRENKNLSGVTSITALGGESEVFAVGGKQFIGMVSAADLTMTCREALNECTLLKMAAGKNRLAVTLSNDLTRVYSQDLKLQREQAWPPNAKRKNNQPLLKLAVSPDDRYVVSSGMTFSNDCVVLDMDAGGYFLGKGAVTSFAFASPDSLVGVVHGVNSTGASVWEVKVDAGNKTLSGVQTGEVASDDTGFLDLVMPRESGMVALGGIGVAATFRDGTAAAKKSEVLRYKSLVGSPLAEMQPLACGPEGNEIVLGSKSGVQVYVWSDLGKSHRLSKGFNGVVGDSAAYEVRRLWDSLVLSVFSMDEEGVVQRIALPAPAVEAAGWSSIACGMTMSGSENVLAVRFAESNWRLNSDDLSGNYSVVIYRDFAAGEKGWTSKPVAIRLADQGLLGRDAAWGKNRTRLLELSGDGERLVVGTRVKDNGYCNAELYDTRSGKLLRRWTEKERFGRALTLVPGSDQFAEIAGDSRSIILRNWADGEIARKIEGDGEISAFCFSADGGQAVVRIGESKIVRFKFPSGERLGEVATAVVPVSWSPVNNVFLGFLPDNEGMANGSLVLADAADGRVLEIVQKGFMASNTGCSDYARLSKDGMAFGYCDESSKLVILKSMSPEMAMRRLTRVSSAAGSYDRAVWFAPKERLALTPSQAGNFDKLDRPPAGWRGVGEVSVTGQDSTKRQAVLGKVARVIPTQNGKGVNLMLGADEKVLVWLDGNKLGNLPMERLGQLQGKAIVISGIVGLYGGKAEEWKSKTQIALESFSDLKLVDESSEAWAELLKDLK